MRIVLTAVDAKYIHTNLAVRSIAAYVRSFGASGAELELAEYTINHRPMAVLEDLERRGGDVYLFSCYIWNVAMVRDVARELKKLCPRSLLFAGGPEAGAHPEAFLRENPWCAGVIRGEGEESCRELLGRLSRGKDWRDCAGIDSPGRRAADREPLEMDRLPFPYGEEGLEGRILYYESMRGCPFQCTYCLSGIPGGVRMRSLDRVCEELKWFLDAGVPQVKLVDRTFNCAPGRALAIWRFLHQHDNGITNFHFELAGDLLDSESMAFLPQVRPGQFQFEIGVQSANRETLREIDRPSGLEKLERRVRALREAGNIHLHLDLIAGLPEEDFASFRRSFNWVYRLRPHQLQLGFLKVLGGSRMEEKAAEYGLAYQSRAPYQVLRTNWLSFGELCRLGQIEELVEVYHNSGRFSHLLNALCGRFPSPFAFYEALADFWREGGHDQSPFSKIGYYGLLGDFMARRGIPADDRMQWLCRLDLAGHEKIRKLPGWVASEGVTANREEIGRFYRNPENIRRWLPGYVGREPGWIARVCHLEVFPGYVWGVEGDVALLFDYSRRDHLGRAVTQQVLLTKSGDY